MLPHQCPGLVDSSIERAAGSTTRTIDTRLYDFAVKPTGLITKHAQTSPNVYLRGWDGRAVPSTRYGSLRSDAGNIGVFADLAAVKPPSRAAMRAADGAASGRVSQGPAWSCPRGGCGLALAADCKR